MLQSPFSSTIFNEEDTQLPWFSRNTFYINDSVRVKELTAIQQSKSWSLNGQIWFFFNKNPTETSRTIPQKETKTVVILRTHSARIHWNGVGQGQVKVQVQQLRVAIFLLVESATPPESARPRVQPLSYTLCMYIRVRLDRGCKEPSPRKVLRDHWLDGISDSSCYVCTMKRGEAEAETASKRKLTGRFVKARENEERLELDDFGT